MTPRLLRVRCARWDQVDAFLHKKLRADGRLSMKVPFVAEPGLPVNQFYDVLTWTPYPLDVVGPDVALAPGMP